MSEFDFESYIRQLSSSQSIDDCPKVPIPEIQKDQNYLFISYSHKDYKKVYADLAHLHVHGVRFWYDRGLSVGKDWEIEVEEHIKNPRCCGIIFYVSINTFLSNSILKEIGFTQKRKNGNIIYQKNYFCINLHQSSMSEILLDAQTHLKNNGFPLLDTKAVNLLTSTFSDNDTYLFHSSKFHMQELLKQIEQQFDVTGKQNYNPDEALLYTVATPRRAWSAVLNGKVFLLPLLKFLKSAYKEHKHDRPWRLIPVAFIIGLIGNAYTMYLWYSKPENPIAEYLYSLLNRQFILFENLLFSPILLLYVVFVLFWLFYFTPIYQEAKKSRVDKVHNHFFYLSFTLIGGICIIPAILAFDAICLSMIRVFQELVSIMVNSISA